MIPKSTRRIDLDDPLEIEWWCERLRCDEDELMLAVSKVGHLSLQVRRFLARRPQGAGELPSDAGEE
jgi:hypothetical protein